jgi:low affinity Fe/Cu permease
MQMVEGGAFVFALISMLVSVIEYDMRFNNYNQAYINTLLILITLSTIILVGLTFIRYSIEIQLMKEQNILSKRDDLISSGRIYTLMFELLIIVPHPNIAL